MQTSLSLCLHQTDLITKVPSCSASAVRSRTTHSVTSTGDRKGCSQHPRQSPASSETNLSDLLHIEESTACFITNTNMTLSPHKFGKVREKKKKKKSWWSFLSLTISFPPSSQYHYVCHLLCYFLCHMITLITSLSSTQSFLACDHRKPPWIREKWQSKISVTTLQTLWATPCARTHRPLKEISKWRFWWLSSA